MQDKCPAAFFYMWTFSFPAPGLKTVCLLHSTVLPSLLTPPDPMEGVFLGSPLCPAVSPSALTTGQLSRGYCSSGQSFTTGSGSPSTTFFFFKIVSLLVVLSDFT